MIQSQEQIVSLFVRRGAESRPVEENIDRAREAREFAISGEHSQKASDQAYYVSSAVASVVQDQLGVSMGEIMSEEFDILVDWLAGGPAPVPFPFLEALLIMAAHPAAVA